MEVIGEGRSSYKEVLLTLPRPPERVKKKKRTRRKMANRNQARFEDERRR
jgi:hypothetical protein